MPAPTNLTKTKSPEAPSKPKSPTHAQSLKPVPPPIKTRSSKEKGKEGKEQQAPSRPSQQRQQRQQEYQFPKQGQTSSSQIYSKKQPSRSSKPIINWLQRKLAGTVRQRRISDGSSSLYDRGRMNGAASTPRSGRSGSRPSTHWGTVPGPSRNGSRGHRANPSIPPRRTISLNGGDFDDGLIHSDDEDEGSIARSAWSPATGREADEDASLRPLPPSAPPSPSHSHSSSSYLSNPHTFRSMAASTKPTTVLSVDLAPAGIGHIAQVPLTPVSQTARFAHGRNPSTGTNGGLLSSAASMTFSALPPSPQSSSRPSSVQQATGATSSNMMGLQAPQHTSHHPRNNPRPSSPPLDNASMLTLASSAYAISGSRPAMGSVASTSLFPHGATDSISQHGGGSFTGDLEGRSSHFMLGDDDRLDGERDGDASMRALRPRSSRRGSWGSEVSGWSARVLMGVTDGNKSLYTSHSMKTSEPSGVDGDDSGSESSEHGTTDETQSTIDRRDDEELHALPYIEPSTAKHDDKVLDTPVQDCHVKLKDEDPTTAEQSSVSIHGPPTPSVAEGKNDE